MSQSAARKGAHHRTVRTSVGRSSVGRYKQCQSSKAAVRPELNLQPNNPSSPCNPYVIDELVLASLGTFERSITLYRTITAVCTFCFCVRSVMNDTLGVSVCMTRCNMSCFSPLSALASGSQSRALATRSWAVADAVAGSTYVLPHLPRCTYVIPPRMVTCLCAVCKRRPTCTKRYRTACSTADATSVSVHGYVHPPAQARTVIHAQSATCHMPEASCNLPRLVRAPWSDLTWRRAASPPACPPGRPA